MNEEELFCKLFLEYAVNGKPLSPYFDLFESGFEQAENRIEQLEKENVELKEKLGNYQKGMFDEIEKRDKQLTKAKEIIKAFLDSSDLNIKHKAEEFLGEF